MRKKIYTILLGVLLLGPSLLLAQQLQTTKHGEIQMPETKYSKHHPSQLQRVTAATCAIDTAAYTIFKATSLAGLLVNNATSAAKVGQYFNASQPITVHAFRFYAWKTDATGGINTNAICQLFNAGPDSLPMGAALATISVPVDTNFGGGDLDVLQKMCNLNSPITFTAPYVLVIGNPTPNSIGVVVDDYQVADGAGEWLGSAELGGNWTPGYNVTLGIYPFDADIMIDPLVSYDLAANFTHTPSCVAAAGNVTFTNTSSPVFMDRMYNAAVALGLAGIGVDWDFGDGTVIQQAVQIDTVHGYAAAGNYIVTLVDTLFGWSGGYCGADTSITLAGAPNTQYSSVVNGNIVDFTDLTGSLNGTYAWDFGDGATSALQNPSHTYSALGNYNVCLTVTDACGTDSVCHPFVINAVGVGQALGGASFTLFPNPNTGLAKVSISLAESQDLVLHVYNAMGTLVRTLEIANAQTTILELPLQGLANGNYLVEMRGEKSFQVVRMQIAR